MAVIKMSFLTVLKRFPSHEMSIKRLYREDETFQSICEDHEECSAALERWNQSTSEEAASRRKEYAELLEDLEKEILQYLREHIWRQANRRKRTYL